MIQNLIIVVPAPFGEREYKRYGIDIIKKNDINVFVFDVTPILYPEVYKKMQLPDPIIWDNLYVIKDNTQFLEELQKIGPNRFVYLTISFNLTSYPIYRAISRHKIPYCVTDVNALPSFGSEYPRTLKDRVLGIAFKKILSKFITITPFPLLGLHYASLVAVIADKARFERPEVSSSTRVCYTHSSDYDNYMEANAIDEELPEGLIYLDNYLPYHPDGLYHGEESPVDADRYHEALNRMFEKLEAETGLKVIIAAHPKSNYGTEFNPFNGRPTFRGKTAQLVKKSHAVILNFSTSINFALLNRKPLFFFTTNELQLIQLYRRHIAGIASLFDKVPINIDESYEIDMEELYKFNENKYQDYKNDYIKKTGTPELNSWQIKCNEINQFFN